MDILDLTPVYIRDPEHEHYEATYPALFRHYFRFWADVQDDTAYPDEVVRENARRIRERLPLIRRRLTRTGLPLPDLVVLLVGKGTTNGHAFWDPARQAFVVWLPVEAYATRTQVDIFVTHECLHALHYTHQPAFYFTDEREQHLVGRQLITEGVATWGTRVLSAGDDIQALWADYLAPDAAQRWYRQCQYREQEMAQRLLEEWEESRETNPWFSMWDAADVTRYRGGYYMGLQVMRRLHQRHALDLPALLRLDAQTLEAWTLEVLREMASRPPAAAGTPRKGGIP
ncbi:MAG: hypothetical protein GXO55_06415 [Chloroflexi bacterium]|nr:hypothetical protein [Chloroflexota bacterium]